MSEVPLQSCVFARIGDAALGGGGAALGRLELPRAESTNVEARARIGRGALSGGHVRLKPVPFSQQKLPKWLLQRKLSFHLDFQSLDVSLRSPLHYPRSFL